MPVGEVADTELGFIDFCGTEDPCVAHQRLVNVSVRIDAHVWNREWVVPQLARPAIAEEPACCRALIPVDATGELGRIDATSFGVDEVSHSAGSLRQRKVIH